MTQEELPTMDQMELVRTGQLLFAISDPRRATIVAGVGVVGEMTVSDMADLCQCNMQNASSAARTLKGAGLLVNREEGRFQWYSLAPGYYLPPARQCDLFGLQLGTMRVYFMHPEPPAAEPEPEAVAPKPKKGKGRKARAKAG